MFNRDDATSSRTGQRPSDDGFGFDSNDDRPGDDTMRPHFDGADPNEARHRREAVRHHQKRIFAQGTSAVFSALIILFAPVYWRSLLRACGFDLSAAWPATSWENALAAALGGTDGMAGGLLLPLLFGPAVFVFLSAFYLNVRYRFLRDQEWNLRSAEAESNEPRTAASGYMHVFRLYARTKRRAVFALVSSIAWLSWGIVGVFALMFASPEAGRTLWTVAFGSAALATAGSALFMAYAAYDVSRRYVPGKVLVGKTMIFATRAATSQTDYETARSQAAVLQEAVIEERPWWFYSYARAPKRR
ncbi:MAG: hypothetical protein AAF224_04810 [Pseudomonadota bacterium]